MLDVNRYLQKRKFQKRKLQMETFKSVKERIQQKNFLVSVDQIDVQLNSS